MPVWTAQRGPRSVGGIATLVRPILDARTYARILYLLLALPLGVAEFSFLVTAISIGFGTAITLIGIPVLIGTMWAWRWIADFERRLIGRLVGVDIPSPYRPDPAGVRWWRRVAARGSPTRPRGRTSRSCCSSCRSGSCPSPSRSRCSAPGSAALFAPVLLLGRCPTTPRIAWLDDRHARRGARAGPARGARPARRHPGPERPRLGCTAGWPPQLLGSNADPVLTAQVTELQDARSRIIAAADAERRRIERDLHDGAQQRLVALALNLRMAEKRAAERRSRRRRAGAPGRGGGPARPEGAARPRPRHPPGDPHEPRPAGRARGPRRARDGSVERGRGARPSACPDPVEAAAYFVVSECLANIGKHAEASYATVSVTAWTTGSSTVVVTRRRGGRGVARQRDRHAGPRGPRGRPERLAGASRARPARARA